jgi:hypothetical protein
MTFNTYHLPPSSSTYLPEFQPDLFRDRLLMPPCGRSSRPYCQVELISSSNSVFECIDCHCYAPYRGSVTERSDA